MDAYAYRRTHKPLYIQDLIPIIYKKNAFLSLYIMFKKLIILLVFSLLILSPLGSRAEDILIDDFSAPTASSGVPVGWKELHFPSVKKHTKYKVIGDGNRYLRAYSTASASAIYQKVDIDINDFPILKWRWKVDNILEKGFAGKKTADDFPARLYVAFSFSKEKVSFMKRIKRGALKAIYGDEAPGEAITYIWANKLPVGDSAINPYAEESIMLAVKSGQRGVGRWFNEERNVYEDYKKLFGREPAGVIKAIFIMTDTDNTGERATAYYDDIRFSEKKQ